VDAAMAFVRIASSDEYPAIARIDEWHDASPEAITAGRCTVAGRLDQIEAYAIVSRWFGNKPLVETVFVATRARRRGLGSALLASIESTYPDSRLWISTGLQNVPMQRLLQKRGYELCGTIEKLAKIPELIYSRPATEAGN
jgi:GNAT superfamily N-acetyltransferase